MKLSSLFLPHLDPIAELSSTWVGQLFIPPAARGLERPEPACAAPHHGAQGYLESHPGVEIAAGEHGLVTASRPLILPGRR